MTEIKEKAVLNDEVLNEVVGGVRSEYEDIAKLLPRVKQYLYGGSSYMRAMGYKEVQTWLKDNLNIDADISVGNRYFNRPGNPNTYSRNGETLSHEDVVVEVKNFLGI